MSCPTRHYRFFNDPAGVRWGVETRLVGEGADAIPVGFAFTSDRGEHRTLVGSSSDGLSWDQFSDVDWCELLSVSRVVRSAARHGGRFRHLPRRRIGRP